MGNDMGAASAEDKYSEGALEIALRQSPWAAVIIAVAALACVAVAIGSGGSAAARAIAATWATCLALEAIHRVALHRGRAGATRIVLRRPRDIEVRDGAGAWRAGAIADGCFVASWLTIVRWRPAGAWVDRTIVVLPDMIGAEEFRRLRVMLRWA
jgi:hypothetical protein